MRTTTASILCLVLVACSSPGESPTDAGSHSDAATDSGVRSDAGVHDGSVGSDASIADASGDAAIAEDGGAVDDAGTVDAGPAPSLDDAIAALVDSACDFQELCASGAFDHAGCEADGQVEINDVLVARNLLDPRRTLAAADCVHAISECDTTSGVGAPQVVLDCLEEAANMGDATWYNCLGRVEECNGMSMPFVAADTCWYFSMMTDAARAQGQSCISMSSCSDGQACLEEFIFN